MLHRLEIENFHSIRERQVIDLVARGNASNEDGRLAPLWPGSKELAPKVVAVFGANAAGKTNVLLALKFLVNFVQTPHPKAANWHLRFLNDEAHRSSSYFCVHFSGPEDLTRTADADTQQCRYEYELTLGHSDEFGQIVESERLSFWPQHAKRQVRIFERNNEGGVKFHKDLVIGRDYLSLLKLGLPRNASVIAVLGSVGHVALQFFISQANLILTYIALENDTPISSEVVDFYLKNPSVLVQLNKDIDALGLGIHKIEITTSQDRTFMMFHHEGLIQPIISQFESNGTRQAVKLFPYIGVVLSRGGIAVIDELDQALHPFVLSEVVRWFHDPIRNPHNAQLWMTCQNASLLHELDKEEVLFCEKDSKGQTSVYSLADVKGARRGEDFYKKYLGGVYGAVPQIG